MATINAYFTSGWYSGTTHRTNEFHQFGTDNKTYFKVPSFNSIFRLYTNVSVSQVKLSFFQYAGIAGVNITLGNSNAQSSSPTYVTTSAVKVGTIKTRVSYDITSIWNSSISNWGNDASWYLYVDGSAQTRSLTLCGSNYNNEGGRLPYLEITFTGEVAYKTRTYTYNITTYTGDVISSNTGKQLNLSTKFTVSGDTTPMGRVASVTCNFPIISTSHRSNATIQTTFSNTSTSETYASDVVTKTLSSGGGYVATVNHTWETPPPASFFNDPANTTVSIRHTNTSVGSISLRGKTYKVTITVFYEEAPSAYIYTDNNEWVSATPYIYVQNEGWKQANIGVYDLNNEWK